MLPMESRARFQIREQIVNRFDPNRHPDQALENPIRLSSQIQDQCQSKPCIARSRFNDRATGVEAPGSFCLFNHFYGNAVLELDIPHPPGV
jgi:hypothetical protein